MKRVNWSKVLYVAIFIVAIIVIVGCIALRIYALNKYGDTPLKEVPTWVYWVLKG